MAVVCSNGIAARLMSQSGQRFVEVPGLKIPSPPWSDSAATITISVPAMYQGGLNGFYLEQRVNQNGTIPYQQSGLSIDGRSFVVCNCPERLGSGPRFQLSTHDRSQIGLVPEANGDGLH